MEIAVGATTCVRYLEVVRFSEGLLIEVLLYREKIKRAFVEVTVCVFLSTIRIIVPKIRKFLTVISMLTT